MISPRSTTRADYDSRTIVLVLALGIVLLSALAVLAAAAFSPSAIGRGTAFITGSFAPSSHADYSGRSERPVAPQRAQAR